MPRLILGLQPVREAIRVHGRAVERVVVARARSARLAAVARFAADQGIPVDRAQPGELDRLARGVRHQGVGAFGPELQLLGLEDLVPERDQPLLALDGITDPHNFGAAIRSAVALGSGAVLWAEHHSAPLTAATFRASAGAVEHARLFRVPSLRKAVGALGAMGYTTLALELAAPLELEALGASSFSALVVGAEDRGVRKSISRACSHRVRLPMGGPVQSLNASVAAAVALYALARRADVIRP